MESLISRILPETAGGHPFFIILGLLSIFFITVHMGMHPIVAGSAIAVSIPPEALGFTPLMFGTVLLSGWVLGTLLSPFSATNIVIGAMTEQPSWHISTKRHGLFTLTMTIILSAVMALLSRFI